MTEKEKKISLPESSVDQDVKEVSLELDEFLELVIQLNQLLDKQLNVQAVFEALRFFSQYVPEFYFVLETEILDRANIWHKNKVEILHLVFQTLSPAMQECYFPWVGPTERLIQKIRSMNSEDLRALSHLLEKAGSLLLKEY